MRKFLWPPLGQKATGYGEIIGEELEQLVQRQVTEPAAEEVVSECVRAILVKEQRKNAQIHELAQDLVLGLAPLLLVRGARLLLSRFCASHAFAIFTISWDNINS